MLLKTVSLDSVRFSFPDRFSISGAVVMKMAAKREELLSLCELDTLLCSFTTEICLISLAWLYNTVSMASNSHRNRSL